MKNAVFIMLFVVLLIVGIKITDKIDDKQDKITVGLENLLGDIKNLNEKLKIITIEGIKHNVVPRWGPIPSENFCVGCGKFSVDKFCTSCGRERKESKIMVYCPKCDPEGKYGSFTTEVGKICGDCGTEYTYKLVPYQNCEEDKE